MKKKVIAVIGARPQFIKHVPFELEAKDRLNLLSIHTGQHYDANMSEIFFEQLGIREPDYMLRVGSHSHGKQTALMLVEIEKILIKEQPNIVLVYGDTNSTLAAALAASKLNISVVHVEAGLRSFNRTMPEEINRIVADHISSTLIVSTRSATENLENEGLGDKVVKLGDIMRDMVEIAKKKGMLKRNQKFNTYYYATIHRPYNTDEESRLRYVLNALNNLGMKVVFSLHPRTKGKIEEFNIEGNQYENIEFISPQGYFENLNFQFNGRAIITDSGGMQKEAYMLKRRCITIRPETEWVETLEGNWNNLVFDRLTDIREIVEQPLGDWEEELYGSGQTGKRMVDLMT